jgi:hypothetical protein
MINLYQEKVKNLSTSIYEPEIKNAAMDTLRPLIDRIVIKPTNLDEIKAELYGNIASLVALESEKGQNFSDLSVRLSVVAGVVTKLSGKLLIHKKTSALATDFVLCLVLLKVITNILQNRPFYLSIGFMEYLDVITSLLSFLTACIALASTKKLLIVSESYANKIDNFSIT